MKRIWQILFLAFLLAGVSLTFNKLVPSAQAAGSTITIYAAGTPTSGVYPTMQLQINDVTVQTWNNVQGDAYNRSFQQFSYVSSSTISPYQIKVRFTNDASNGTEDRNLRVDKIVLDGTTIETESSSVYSEGSWDSGSGCNGGYKQSEWLHCNGYFQYGLAPVQSAGYPIYADSLTSGWVNWSWSSTTNFSDKAHPYIGSSDISWKGTSAYAGLYLHTDAGVNTGGYSALNFAVQATRAGEKLGLQLYGNSNKELGTMLDISKYGGDVTSGSYKEYTIPLADLGGANMTLTGFHLQSITDTTPAVIYVDAVSLKGTTSTTPTPTPTQTPVPTMTPTPTFTPTPTQGVTPTPTLNPSGSTIVISAAGTPTSGVYPTMQLLINDQVVQTWSNVMGDPNARSFQQFSYASGTKVALSQIKVQFINDASNGSEDRNLLVDNLTLDGKVYETESNTTYSVGSWNAATGCNGGFKQSEWLHCNGYFQYGQSGTPSGTPVPSVTPTPGSTGGGSGYTASSGVIYRNGAAITLRGVNWYGAENGSYVPGGLWIRSYKDMISQMKTLGFNAVRIPYCTNTLKGVGVSNIDYGKNPDLSGQNSLGVMDKIVAELNNQQMYILFDDHLVDCNDLGELWYNGTVSESQWLSDLTSLATRYKSYDYFLGIDPKNEPHGSASWGTGNSSTDWNLAAERAGKTILSADPNLLVFIEGIGDTGTCSGNTAHWWGGNLEPFNCAPISTSSIPGNKLVLSPHVYGPDVYNADYFNNGSFPGNLNSLWDQWFGFLAGKGQTVVIGEWGGKYGTDGGNPKDVQTQDALVSYLTSKHICNSFWWSWNPTSGDVGGILQSDWNTPWTQKMTLLNNYYNSCK